MRLREGGKGPRLLKPLTIDARLCGLGDAVVAAWIAEGANATGEWDARFVEHDAGAHTTAGLRVLGQRFTPNSVGGILLGGTSESYRGELRIRGVRPPRPELWQRWMPCKVEPRRPAPVLPPEAVAWAKECRRAACRGNKPLALLFPYSAQATRNWPYHKWHRLAYTLELSAGWATYSLHHTKEGIDNLPHFMYGESIERVAALMLEADCVIAGDSGPAHLAGTLGTKTFVVIGAMNPTTVFGYLPEVEPLRVTAAEVPCVGCHFEFDSGYWKACDYGCEALNALPWHVVYERVLAWRRENELPLRPAA